jgi:hypothetical protein
MFELCGDCKRAEREFWPVYSTDNWCCRARHIVDASVSCVRDGVTLEDAQRAYAAEEKKANPAEWPFVRERLAILKARQK